MDNALMLNADRLKIIHGKGDGILRKQIRQYLRKYPTALHISDEDPQYGGDGITIIQLWYAPNFDARPTLTMFETLSKLNARPPTGVGSESYSAALIFYQAVKMAKMMNIAGTDSIYEDLAKRFSGRGLNEEAPAPPPTEEPEV